MAWNEPGGGNKDPWSGKGGKGGGDGPPDLDEVVRKLQDRLGGLFGGKRSGSGGAGGAGGAGGSGSGGGGISGRAIGIGVAVILVLWLASGIYIVAPAERGVVMRFGVLVDIAEPGPHLLIPPYPVHEVVKVNVDAISTFTHAATMLTQDENIVDVELTVQSRIRDAADFLFQDQSPEKTLRDATETMVRETIGASRLDFILTEGRSAIADSIAERVQMLMDLYKTGLEVTSVNMQPARPPEQVKDAFDDAIKAREDKERIQNQAEAYANEIIPRARGEAARIEADAMGYRDRVIAVAEGEAARFLAILAEYEKAPQVTRERLHLETIEDVLSRNGKVLLDASGGNSLLYLPIDQLIKQRSTQDQASSQASGPRISQEPTPLAMPEREVIRDRRSR